MAKNTLKNAPPIRGLKREPRDTDASVTIGGATPIIQTVQSQKTDKKKSGKKSDKRLRIAIANMEQLEALQTRFGLTKPAVINVALTCLAKEFLSP
jgi:hypothetical protein